MLKHNQWVDTHCHLFDQRYLTAKISPHQIYETAMRHGAAWICNVGVDLLTSQTAIAHAQQLRHCFAAVGIHPHAAQTATPTVLSELATLIPQTKVIAIGEIGLDYYYLNSPIDTQITLLRYQLALAVKHQLPVLLHVRSAFAALRTILVDYAVTGIVHCFNGTLADAQWLLQRQFKLGIGGIITYPNATALQQVVKALPLTAFVLETDAPYLAPQSHRGQINYPHYLLATAQKIADLHQLPISTVLAVTTRTAQQILQPFKSD